MFYVARFILPSEKLKKYVVQTQKNMNSICVYAKLEIVLEFRKLINCYSFK